MSSRKGILEHLDGLLVAPLGKTSSVHGVTERTSLRTLQSLIPFATKIQISSYAVKAWLTFVMPKLQKEGYNFHDAFKIAAKLWNASSHSAQNNFRIPYEWSKVKNRGKGKGGKIENQYHIRKILEIPDTKQETVVGSLGLELREIWPEVVLGNNQFKRRK